MIINKIHMLKIACLFLCMVFIQEVNAQWVRGSVRSSEDNEALAGVSVSVKGTTDGVVTDADGKYKIEVNAGGAVLVFSYLGMQTQEVPVTGTEINVVLVPDSKLLDQVVVVGYGSQKRSTISGAVSTITSEEITETPVTRIEQALQGRTAGVQIAQNSGSPGSPLMVRIRGAGTINNSDPLYIVDGVPVSGLDFLNPADIESINVLKDAASAAIYGARGANGVILIKTFSGRKNEGGTIQYQSYYGVQSVWKKLNLMDAREYAIISNEAHIAGGKTPLPQFSNPDALGKGTDWLDELFQTAPIMDHNLSIMGSSDKSSYVVSGNYFGQNGIVGGDKSDFNRLTARINTTNKVNKWLSIGNTFNYTWLRRNFLPENNEFTTPLMKAINIDPTTPVRKEDGTFAYSPYADTDISNPLNQIATTYDKWTTNRIVGSVFAEVETLEGLKVKTAYSMDNTFATRNIFYPKFDLSVDPVLSDAPSLEKRLINSVVINNYAWKNWQWENTISYNKKFGSKHNTNWVLGTAALNNRYDYSGGSNSNLPSNNPDDAYIDNTIDPIESQTSSGGASESSLNSYFGRVNYDYSGKYMATATLRADGSSRFGANNRWGYFPSFSAGWLLSEESFWESGLVSTMKLRASWGQNGNDNIGNYSYTSVVSSGQNYTFGPGETITNGSVSLTAANPDLKWETTTQSNVGIDMEMWKGRLNLSTDFYIKKTSDMLYAIPVLLTSGTGAPTQNIASAKNTGWELAASYRNADHPFKWELGGNITVIKNKVTDLGTGGEPISSGHVQSANANVARTDVGHPLGSFFGYVTDGIFQTNEEVASHAFQNENTSPGDIRFKDLNGDHVIDIKDMTYIGNPIPDFTYGFTADFSFKGFDLKMFWQGTQGNDIYNATVRYDFTYVNRPVSTLERWTGPGTSNTEPRVSLTDPNQNARVSDRFVEDGSYIRLKNIQLGYSLPTKWLDVIKVKECRIYISGQNLLTFTKYSGMDPEIGVIGSSLEMGIDKGFYPQARTILGGISVKF